MKNLGGWEPVVFKLCKLGLPPFPNNRNPLLKTLMVTSTGKGVQANIYKCSTKFHIDNWFPSSLESSDLPIRYLETKLTKHTNYA